MDGYVRRKVGGATAEDTVLVLFSADIEQLVSELRSPVSGFLGGLAIINNQS